MDRLLTAEEIAERLGMKTQWVWTQASAERIPHVRLGPLSTFPRVAIEAGLSKLDLEVYRTGWAYFVSAVSRELRTPPELRGDWWTAVERKFRAYQRAAARRHPRGEPGKAG